jgi:UDP-N-acetylglucosamine--N-acetylmuramyl-(pentapeptide) pyrophosphoryl-undecaprenol N-acetylglucosamine transferase
MLKTRPKIILITGGHGGSTAFALVQKLNKAKFNKEIHFIGAKKSMEGMALPTLESKVLPKLGVIYHYLYSGRIQRQFTIWTIPSLLKIPIGFVHALYLVGKIRPDILVSFGGYSAFPVVVATWIFGVPIIIHEQTCAVGRANKYSSFFATKIALARSESRKYFPSNKCVAVGNPVSESILGLKTKKTIHTPPHILISGGSRGSMPINNAIKEVLPALLENYYVVHQTGAFQFDEFSKIREALSSDKKLRYKIVDTVDYEFWYKYLADADICITRSGANTVSEVMSVKIPSIFIPLPFAYMNEQLLNALYAKNFGIASILEQNNLTSKTLLHEVENIHKNWSHMLDDTFKKESPDVKASDKLSKLVVETM